MSEIVHSSFCKQREAAAAKAIEAYEAKWPMFCRKCGGRGLHYYDYDPSPAGVGLAPGYMTDCDPCPDCIERGICPRCGQELTIDEDGEECSACGWLWDAELDASGQPIAQPPEWECYCGETW